MKKLLFILLLLCCLALCSAALADDQVIPVALGDVDAGTISVPENVIALTEKGGSGGIVCSRNTNGTELTVALQEYEFFHGAGKTGLHQAGAGDRVVIVELEERTLYAGFGEPITMEVPTFRTGRVKSYSGSSLVLESFELKADPSGGESVSKEDWEEYCRYITDKDIHYSSRTAANGEHRVPIDTEGETYHFKINLKGALVWEFDVDVDRSPTWWDHYHIYAKALLEVESLVLTAESDDVELTIPLPSIPISMGMAIPISFTAQATYKGSLAVSFSKGFDVTIDFDVGFCNPDFTASSSTLGTDPVVVGQNGLSVFVGMETGLMGDLFDIIEAGIAFDAGFQFDNYWYHDHFFVKDEEDIDKNRYHACDQCYYLEISPAVGPLALKVTVIKIFSRSLDLIERHTFPPVYRYHNSSTFEDEHGDGPCPLVAYKVTVHVANEKGIPIGGAEVSYDPSDEKHYKGVTSGTTDENGNVDLYLPVLDADKKTPNKVTFTASTQNPEDPNDKLSSSVAATGLPQVQAFPIIIVTKACSVSFMDSGSGTVENMPGPIHFFPQKGAVNIPDNIPEKSGLVFTGWNTKADGSGTSVAPGSSYAAKDDTVLYAQWTNIAKYYVIQYNANGGSWAPEGQTVPLGQSALLTDERACWDQHKFLGWSTDDTADTPEYPVGRANEFVNAEQKFIVTLYAVWGFYPVDPPIGISFDMNGGPAGRAPATQWITRGSWMMIPTQRVWWDDVHRLRGWSTDPDAADPTYFAGRSYHFTESTKLYAVWEKLPLCRLSFRDETGNDAANMPGDVLFVPDVSPWVSVPDTIPSKSGRHFTGWNTKPDGSGEDIQPGAVILLYQDTTIYAQWEVVGNLWMVLFNANGGERAPRPQFCRNGQDMTLTAEPAAWINHKFLGWSTDDTADVPEYPAGAKNVIPWSKGKDGLVLYAVWGFSPVDKPVKASFDMSGGPESRKPADQWLPAGSWLVLSSKSPAWDASHIFLGWSRTAGAKKPDYRPGDTVFLTGDTTFYAVWDISYRIIEGDGSVWQTNRNGLRMAANGNINYFHSLQIDGRTVSPGNYTLSSGSTIVVLSPAYLRAMSDGPHRIRFSYKDGQADGVFYIRRKVPLTGDSANPVLWALLALTGTGLFLKTRKKKKS